MAVNKPVGDDARKGAVRKRSQLETKTMGEKALDQAQQGDPVSSWTRRRRESSRAFGGSGDLAAARTAGQ